MFDLSASTVNKMLDYVDFPKTLNVSKRRDAYVTEWYFETSILPEITEGQTSTGWCYVSQNRTRNWFKVTNNTGPADPQRNTDRLIITALKEKDPAQRFFSIFEDRGSVRLREIVHNQDGWRQVRPADTANICNTQLINETATTLSEKPRHKLPFAHIWLNHVPSSYKTNLLIQRLLMNFGLKKKFPLDVDAIEINDGQLVFHEFKRKTKCADGCFIVGDIKITRRMLKNILDRCNAAGLPYGDKLFDFVKSNLKYQRDTNAQCYGLDKGHLSNYEFCHKHEITFRHTIWDSSNYPNKPNISDLFNEDQEPQKAVNLISSQITPDSFMGFIFTYGDNSGTITSDLRIQATLRAECFE
ncbi:hypothetical protein [Marinobacter sp. CHS3-4]|uniref:hypothetical protein n=1 Tax=Marinobacter sp. CHS3-4 TaxID=3045174 RepID=UPI0024B4CCFE|nr:hypothetical protein [Marinobacter sp. CHS3-4]MDI9245981.1 hypothetical protein [Marinobacter sp. CHS3-4]